MFAFSCYIIRVHTNWESEIKFICPRVQRHVEENWLEPINNVYITTRLHKPFKIVKARLCLLYTLYCVVGIFIFYIRLFLTYMYTDSRHYRRWIKFFCEYKFFFKWLVRDVMSTIYLEIFKIKMWSCTSRTLTLYSKMHCYKIINFKSDNITI